MNQKALENSLQRTGMPQLAISAMGMIGATALAIFGVVPGEQALAIYTMVFGYVFGANRRVVE